MIAVAPGMRFTVNPFNQTASTVNKIINKSTNRKERERKASQREKESKCSEEKKTKFDTHERLDQWSVFICANIEVSGTKKKKGGERKTFKSVCRNLFNESELVGRKKRYKKEEKGRERF